MENATDLTVLRELVQRFRVCWKVWPEFTYVNHEQRQIGYGLELAGTHEPWVKHPEPGCEHCRRIFVVLREIANWILPRDQRPSTYEIGPYDQAIRYMPSRHDRPDVIFTVKILHREGYDGPVDECEDRCLKEMEEGLKALGACRLRSTGGRSPLPRSCVRPSRSTAPFSTPSACFRSTCRMRTFPRSAMRMFRRFSSERSVHHDDRRNDPPREQGF